MTWLATSPHGPQRTSTWMCTDCAAGPAENAIGADPDIMRAAAMAHAEETGHHTAVTRGTVEMIWPLATTPQDTP